MAVSLTPLAPATVVWPEIEALDAERPRVEFPTSALPRWLSSFVAAQAEASQVPVDMVGMLSLAMLSTAVQGRMNVYANGMTWREPVTLYAVVAMSPGERKSAIFDALSTPLIDWEEAIQDLERPLVAESQQQMAELERAVDSLASAVGKARMSVAKLERDDLAAPDTVRSARGDLDSLRQEETDAREELARFKPRYKMRLLSNDLTPEACVRNLSQQRGERMAVLSAEGGSFDVLSGNRYSDQSNLDVFLKGHAGDLIQVDRVGRDAERINRPMLTLGLAVQPSVLSDIGHNKAMAGRGLLARFLYCMPDSMLGFRKIDAAPVPAEVRALYAENLRAIASAAYAQNEVRAVALSEEADDLFGVYQERLEPMLAPDTGELAMIPDWAGKLAGAILRIAALIAAARVCGMPDEVDEDDMRQAIEFHDYLVWHAMRAFGMMGLVPNVRFESMLVKVITEKRLESFTVRELMRITAKARQYSAGEIEEYLDGLEKMGYVRRQIVSVKPHRVAWQVNPALFEADVDD